MNVCNAFFGFGLDFIIFVVLICLFFNVCGFLNDCHNKLKGLSASATMMAGFPL